MERDIKKVVREGYARIANQGTSSKEIVQEVSRNIGYSNSELAAIPDGANLGLGCGNPIALASLKGGETVLDLGSELLIN